MYKKVEWYMDCKVNGVDFSLNGTGTASESNGINDMVFDASGAPKGFDPISCPMICNVVLTSYIAQTSPGLTSLANYAGNSLEVSPARTGRIHNSDGKELLNLQVATKLVNYGDTIIVESQMRGESHLPELARNIAPIKDYFLPNGEGSATGVVRFELETKAGEILYGSTMSPYKFDGASLENILMREVSRVDVEFSSLDAIRAIVQSRWVPLERSKLKGVDVAA